VKGGFCLGDLSITAERRPDMDTYILRGPLGSFSVHGLTLDIMQFAPGGSLFSLDRLCDLSPREVVERVYMGCADGKIECSTVGGG